MTITSSAPGINWVSLLRSKRYSPSQALKLALQFRNLFGINGLLDALNQRKNVAHAKDAGNNALGIEGIQRVIFFTRSHELYRRASHLAYGKSRAAAGIAVQFGEDYAAQAELFMKFACRADPTPASNGWRALD